MTAEAWDQVVGLVASAGLPTDDLVPGRQRWFSSWNGSELRGVIAWELLGSEALVRSFAVAPDLRGHGIGTQLYRDLEGAARAEGLERLVLLTETAEAFFVRQGFIRVDRASLSEAVQATAEFTGLCPASAVCLMKSLN